MKISVAQIRPKKGAIAQNIERHKQLIELAASMNADSVFFPELSITGYEPALAKTLATKPDSSLFDSIQHLSNQCQLTIGLGMPTKHDDGIKISMLLFQAFTERQYYSKQHLHQDELPFFIAGNKPAFLGEKEIALAICYEISIPEHAEYAKNSGASIYVASVAKSEKGMKNATARLANIAASNSMIVYCSNCVGYCDNFESAGQSAIWDNTGKLVAQLDNSSEGLLLFDTVTKEVLIEKI